jgi:toxin ParE1/3/4
MIEIYKKSLAEEDLIEIWLYTFEKWGAKQADTYLDQLNSGFCLLSENPKIGKNCAAIRKGYRRFQIKNHIVYYLLKSDRIDIIRVLHESMEPELYFENE